MGRIFTVYILNDLNTGNLAILELILYIMNTTNFFLHVCLMSLQLGGSVCKRDGSRSNSLTRGNELFLFSGSAKKQIATFSCHSHMASQKLCGNWRTECLNSRFRRA